MNPVIIALKLVNVLCVIYGFYSANQALKEGNNKWAVWWGFSAGLNLGVIFA